MKPEVDATVPVQPHRFPRLLLVGPWVLIVVAALFLTKWGSLQRLSAPGVRLKAENLYYLPPGIPEAATAEPGLGLAGTNVVALPEQLAGFRTEAQPLAWRVYDLLPKDTTFGQRQYIAIEGGFYASVFVVLMGTDRTSIHQPQYCLVGQGFEIAAEENATIRMDRPHAYDLPVKKIIAKRPRHRLENGQTIDLSGVFIYWFASAEALTAEHHVRMSSMATRLLTSGVLERWAYITYFAPCLPGQEEVTYERLKDLIRSTVPEYQLVAGRPSND